MSEKNSYRVCLMRKYKIIEAHYGEKHSFWRVVVTSEQGEQFQTVGKFPTREQADKYVEYLVQSQDKRHNQW